MSHLSIFQWSWVFLFVMQSVAASAGSNIAAPTLEQLDRQVYGADPLAPSPTSLLGQFLAESKACSWVRTFNGLDGKPGPKRLVVLVSGDSFELFQKYFDEAHFLYHFHEPHQRIFNAAYEGHRGTLGRLRDSFRYTYSGVLLIPILLTDSEATQTEHYFDLALKTSRKNDVALFPWKLNDGEKTYMNAGDDKSLSDWFIRMPIGEVKSGEARNAYDVSQLPETIRTAIQDVWTAPRGRQSLADLVGAQALEQKGANVTPGTIAATMLSSAPVGRIPVVFRFTDDAISAFQLDFDTYFDLTFNPSAEAGN